MKSEDFFTGMHRETVLLVPYSLSRTNMKSVCVAPSVVLCLFISGVSTCFPFCFGSSRCLLSVRELLTADVEATVLLFMATVPSDGRPACVGAWGVRLVCVCEAGMW